MTVHIHAPSATTRTLITAVCPDCKHRTRLLSFFTPWYGDDCTCLRCGRRWMDGEWMPLPFMRAARKESIQQAKRRWRSMSPAAQQTG